MRGQHHSDQTPHVAGKNGLEITVECCPEGLDLLPLRMLWRQCLDPIHGEGDLEIRRPLGPECPVVVKGGDALRRRDVVR
jgi:hypothetical protein